MFLSSLDLETQSCSFRLRSNSLSNDEDLVTRESHNFLFLSGLISGIPKKKATWQDQIQSQLISNSSSILPGNYGS